MAVDAGKGRKAMKFADERSLLCMVLLRAFVSNTIFELDFD